MAEEEGVNTDVPLKNTSIADKEGVNMDVPLKDTSMAEEEGVNSEVPLKNTSKTLVLTGHGGEDKFKVEERPKPKPGKGEVVINIKANGINFADVMCRIGLYEPAPKPPCVLGVEGAGVVVELGEGVKEFEVGDRVLCANGFNLWAEFVAIPTMLMVKMPDEMTFEEGAAFPVNYMTAYLMLFEQGNLREGQKVLLHMAAGGVGIAALQLCQTVPNVTVFGTASASKHDVIKQYGCTHPIDYRTQDYVEEIRKISKDGVDIVCDPLAGADTKKGLDLLKPLGKIIVFGAANSVSGHKKNLMKLASTWWKSKSVNPLFDLMPSNKSVCGLNLGTMMFNNPEILKASLEKVMEIYNAGKIKPKIDSVWSYEEVDNAMAQILDRKNIGKVIIKPYKDEQGASPDT